MIRVDLLKRMPGTMQRRRVVSPTVVFWAGAVVGARVPVVVPSRADTVKTKLYSIAFGAILSGERG